MLHSIFKYRCNSVFLLAKPCLSQWPNHQTLLHLHLVILQTLSSKATCSEDHHSPHLLLPQRILSHALNFFFKLLFLLQRWNPCSLKALFPHHWESWVVPFSFCYIEAILSLSWPSSLKNLHFHLPILDTGPAVEEKQLWDFQGLMEELILVKHEIHF